MKKALFAIAFLLILGGFAGLRHSESISTRAESVGSDSLQVERKELRAVTRFFSYGAFVVGGIMLLGGLRSGRGFWPSKMPPDKQADGSASGWG